MDVCVCVRIVWDWLWRSEKAFVSRQRPHSRRSRRRRRRYDHGDTNPMVFIRFIHRHWLSLPRQNTLCGVNQLQAEIESAQRNCQYVLGVRVQCDKVLHKCMRQPAVHVACDTRDG